MTHLDRQLMSVQTSLATPMEGGRKPPTGWLEWGRFYSLSGEQANKVFRGDAKSCYATHSAGCGWEIAQGRGRQRLLLCENLYTVRDFIRCPYNRNNGTSAADDIIQVVRQNDTRQIIARQVIVWQIIIRQIRSKTLMEASESDWKHTRT